MWALAVQLVVGLAVDVLKVWLERSDLQRAERQRLLIDQLGLERAALEWVALALRDPVRAAELRVLHPDLQLSGFEPDAPAGAPGAAARGHL